MFIVYVLCSLSTGKFYIGQTSDLKRRLREHQAGDARRHGTVLLGDHRSWREPGLPAGRPATAPGHVLRLVRGDAQQADLDHLVALPGINHNIYHITKLLVPRNPSPLST